MLEVGGLIPTARWVAEYSQARGWGGRGGRGGVCVCWGGVLAIWTSGTLIGTTLGALPISHYSSLTG